MEPYQCVSASKDLDEYTRWKLEPWVPSVDNPITYWLSLRRDYPNLSRLALDVLSIPASIYDCERMFSELGDLLGPTKRKISPKLLAAMQSVRGWLKFGVFIEGETTESSLSNEVIYATHLYLYKRTPLTHLSPYQMCVRTSRLS